MDPDEAHYERYAEEVELRQMRRQAQHPDPNDPDNPGWEQDEV